MHLCLHSHAGETVKIARIAALVVTCILAAVTGGCAPHSDASSQRLSIVATTGILADLARNVGGDYVDVHQLIPNGADPHSWELSLRGIRDIAYADIAVTNYLMLEDHSVIRALDANLPKDAISLSLAEESAKFGGSLIPLVEDRSLDTPWLGMRVYGDGSLSGAKRSSQVELSVTDVEGPGHACAYITTSFGSPEIAFASRDGFDGGNHWATDTSILPVGAHQHMSWVFTQPGVYTLHLRARLRVTADAEPIELPPSHVTFAVGIDSEKVASDRGLFLLRRGHSDITVDLKSGALTLMVDREKDGGVPEGAPLREAVEESNGLPSTLASLDIERVLIDVPSRTLRQIPKGRGWEFIGSGDGQAYVLPQAVLGKHVHGDIDPHAWHDIHNAQAYVRVIENALSTRDPEHSAQYAANASAYIAKLDETDREVSQTIAGINPLDRKLVTTHDAYAYLARAYDFEIAGYLSAQDGSEASIADRKRIAETLKNMKISAVFLEPQKRKRHPVIAQVAEENGVRVCGLYGDTLDADASTYIDMMKANAHSLSRCLGKDHTS